MEHTQTSGDEPGAEMIAARAATIAPPGTYVRIYWRLSSSRRR